MVKWISRLATNEMFQVRILVKSLACHPLNMPSAQDDPMLLISLPFLIPSAMLKESVSTSREMVGQWMAGMHGTAGRLASYVGHTIGRCESDKPVGTRSRLRPMGSLPS